MYDKEKKQTENQERKKSARKIILGQVKEKGQLDIEKKGLIDPYKGRIDPEGKT